MDDPPASSGQSTASGRVYLFWGDDSLSRAEAVRSFKSRLLSRPGGELNLSECHAPDISARALIEACDTLPFLADRRLIIVHNLFSWRPRASARRRPEPDDAKTEAANPLRSERAAFLAYLPTLAPRTTLVLDEAALSPAQRAEIVGQLPRARADVRAFVAPRGPDLERWLAGRARQRGGVLAPGVAGLLREHGPRSLEALDQEVAKLVTYAGREPVSVSDLGELLPGAEIIVFDLLDAIAEGRSAAALSAFRRLLRQGQRAEELAPQVIALVRRLLVCRLALDEGADPAEVERAHGVKLIDKLRAQARRLPAGRLELALGSLLAFDRDLKRGEVDPESGLELLVNELAATV